MANYLNLKQQFNNNKTFIQQVLQSKKCQLRLKDEGVLILNNLINETTEKLNSIPKVDNPNYSYILINKLNKTLLNLKKWGLINIHQIKGGYTGVTYKYISLNFNKFNKFFINTKKYYHPSIVSLVGTYWS